MNDKKKENPASIIPNAISPDESTGGTAAKPAQELAGL
jgi:hypothetical protein